jgi:hypothetical protein
MLSSCPLVVELSSDLSVLLLLFGLSHKGVLEKFRPRESFTRCLIQESLEETFEFWTHIFWELDWVLHYQVNQSVDTVSVERRCSNVKFVNDDSQRPEINSVIVR